MASGASLATARGLGSFWYLNTQYQPPPGPVVMGWPDPARLDRIDNDILVSYKLLVSAVRTHSMSSEHRSEQKR
jgi:hypothetical protein